MCVHTYLAWFSSLLKIIVSFYLKRMKATGICRLSDFPLLEDHDEITNVFKERYHFKGKGKAHPNQS